MFHLAQIPVPYEEEVRARDDLNLVLSENPQNNIIEKDIKIFAVSTYTSYWKSVATISVDGTSPSNYGLDLYI